MATLGWILISSGPIPPQPVEPAQSASAGGGGGGMMRWDLKRIQNDDDEILAMIKIWVQCN